MTQQAKAITRHTTISIALALTVASVIIAGTSFVTTMKATQTAHLNDPALHHNIVDMVNERYVTRAELDSRFTAIQDTLREIKEGMNRLLDKIDPLIVP